MFGLSAQGAVERGGRREVRRLGTESGSGDPRAVDLRGFRGWQVTQVRLSRGPWSLASDWEEGAGEGEGHQCVSCEAKPTRKWGS